ncbi:hypothetical protein BO86DRAFT_144971 [Aspergillus japonicus CBS 114.51]|uniref:Uncharacterized protein n=1 Tax=Aspergillus japonicus CBS 114.51 TaxID=1448312 RepID=A0A8T8WVG2_ASPJA|nr:hypothetical protein BO86DRAFT_144971 [Aspergillus japonicus CBS 114.51]RAH79825.1 hypothetical protein BO86DRAFT_144971 [Aspergillus japonicus CBS 114.51]
MTSSRPHRGIMRAPRIRQPWQAVSSGNIHSFEPESAWPTDVIASLLLAILNRISTCSTTLGLLQLLSSMFLSSLKPYVQLNV